MKLNLSSMTKKNHKINGGEKKIFNYFDYFVVRNYI